MLGSARATNEENYLAQKFARVVLGTNNVDCCARVCHAPTAAGMKRMLGTGAATNSFDDIEHAARLPGLRLQPDREPPDRRRAHQAGRPARRATDRHRPAPHRTGAHAPTCICALRPGTNVPLLNAHRPRHRDGGLVDDGDACASGSTDCDEFRAFIAAWTPERAAAICGVEADADPAAARLYATAKPAMCFHGLGVTEHMQGTEGVMCLVNLALLTGNLGRPAPASIRCAARTTCRAPPHMGCEPGHLTGYRRRSTTGRGRFEHVWGAPLPSGRGLNLMQMIDAAGAGQLKALWAIGYDILLTNPNARRHPARRWSRSTS